MRPSAFNTPQDTGPVNGASPSVGSQNKNVALALCAVVAAGGWYLLTQNEPPDPGKTMIRKIHGLETNLADPIRKAAMDAATRHTTTPQQLDQAELRTLTVDEIAGAYKPKLTAEEFSDTFEVGYKWDEYSEIFGPKWMQGMYAAAEQGSKGKAAENKLVEKKKQLEAQGRKLQEKKRELEAKAQLLQEKKRELEAKAQQLQQVRTQMRNAPVDILQAARSAQRDTPDTVNAP